MTDTGGNFAFARLAPGDWQVRCIVLEREVHRAMAHVFDGAVSAVQFEVEDSSGDHVEVENTARDALIPRHAPPTDRGAGRVLGRVVESNGGLPAHDAAVWIVSAAGPAPDICPLTDLEGRFVLDDLPPGSWTIAAQSTQGRRGQADAVVRQGETTQVVIRLQDLRKSTEPTPNAGVTCSVPSRKRRS